jgi:hypothetical protein
MFVGGEVHEGKITITKAKIYKKEKYTNLTVYEWQQEYKPEDENQIPDGFYEDDRPGFAELSDDLPF